MNQEQYEQRDISNDVLIETYRMLLNGTIGMDSRYHPRQIVDVLNAEALRVYGTLRDSVDKPVQELSQDLAFRVNFKLALATLRGESHLCAYTS